MDVAAPSEALHELLQRGRQARVVEDGGTQVGTVVADAGNGLGQQLPGFRQRVLQPSGIGRGQHAADPAQVQLHGGQIRADLVVQLCGKMPPLLFLDVHQAVGQIVEQLHLRVALDLVLLALADVADDGLAAGAAVGADQAGAHFDIECAPVLPLVFRLLDESAFGNLSKPFRQPGSAARGVKIGEVHPQQFVLRVAVGAGTAVVDLQDPARRVEEDDAVVGVLGEEIDPRGEQLAFRLAPDPCDGAAVLMPQPPGGGQHQQDRDG